MPCNKVYCWIFLTSESFVEDFESAVAYLVMWPFVMVIFIISIYKAGKAILNLYKHRWMKQTIQLTRQSRRRTETMTEEHNIDLVQGCAE